MIIDILKELYFNIIQTKQMLWVSQTKSYSAQELLGQKARFFHYPKLLEFPLFGYI